MSSTLEICHRGWPLLHSLVRSNLAVFLESVERSGQFLPSFVTRCFHRYLSCGDPKEGFAWLHCGSCRYHRLVPFSCKTRGFCPACGGRRMAERAARWTEELFPSVRVRQFVLTVPWLRRWLLARNPELVKGVLRIAVRQIFGWYRKRARKRGLSVSRNASVTVVQRFGSSLNLNVHFHMLVLDGVYARCPKTGRIRFFDVGKPSTDDIGLLVQRIAIKSERWLYSQGFGPEGPMDSDPEDVSAVLHAASIAGKAALGKRGGFRVRRIQLLKGRPYRLPPRCASCKGYNLHGGIVVGARNRKGLERLCRYIMRPPLAKDRLELLEDGEYLLSNRSIKPY